MENKNAAYWVRALGMEKHPEGGYFRELYKCPRTIAGSRSIASSIYFLLPAGDVSRFHRLQSDELWYFHAGDPVVIYVIDKSGNLSELRLGTGCENGERPQVVIPAGSIFGAAAVGKEGYSLVGCMVCPGFEYGEFELMDRDGLLQAYPQHREIIMKLT